MGIKLLNQKNPVLFSLYSPQYSFEDKYHSIHKWTDDSDLHKF